MFVRTRSVVRRHLVRTGVEFGGLISALPNSGKHRREPPFIVFQVNDFERFRPQLCRNFKNLLDEALAWFVMRMRLAAEDNLQAAEFFCAAHQALGIGQQQVGSFVGGHTSATALMSARLDWACAFSISRKGMSIT